MGRIFNGGFLSGDVSVSGGGMNSIVTFIFAASRKTGGAGSESYTGWNVNFTFPFLCRAVAKHPAACCQAAVRASIVFVTICPHLSDTLSCIWRSQHQVCVRHTPACVSTRVCMFAIRFLWVCLHMHRHVIAGQRAVSPSCCLRELRSPFRLFNLCDTGAWETAIHTRPHVCSYR